VTGFTWDRRKEALNVRKHGVTFDEAASVFDDPARLERFDTSHSGTEDRLMTTGWSFLVRLLTVITSERDHESPRIISAWRATKRERIAYQRRR
jgi:uncharacterized DUF497 family protein